MCQDRPHAPDGRGADAARPEFSGYAKQGGAERCLRLLLKRSRTHRHRYMQWTEPLSDFPVTATASSQQRPHRFRFITLKTLEVQHALSRPTAAQCHGPVIQDRQRHPPPRFQPSCAIGETGLPPSSPASIMPGKVNLVLARRFTMVAARFGNQTTVTFCGANGQLSSTPSCAASRPERAGIRLLASASVAMEKCVDGDANEGCE
jgi:hypothetical protein